MIKKINKNMITKFDKFLNEGNSEVPEILLDEIKKIDSSVLEYMSIIQEDGIEVIEIDDNNRDVVELAKSMLTITKDIIEFGEMFDWKEEDELREYVEENSNDRYTYNYYPGGDSWGVAFSTVRLPKAEEIN